MSLRARPEGACLFCGATLVESRGLGRCPACGWREFAPAD